MLLWLLMGRAAEVENKGLSVWPDNAIWIVQYTLTNSLSLSGTVVTLHPPTLVNG